MVDHSDRRLVSWTTVVRGSIAGAIAILFLASGHAQDRFQFVGEPVPPHCVGLVTGAGNLLGNGGMDLFATNNGTGNVIYPDLGDGSYGPPVYLPLAGLPPLGQDMRIVDMNGDGLDDILGTSTNGVIGYPLIVGVHYFENTGGTFVRAASAYNVAPHCWVVGDVDADGDPDVVVTSLGGSPSPALLVNDGLGHGTLAPGAFAGGCCFPMSSPHLVDLDGDSDLDFVARVSGPNGGFVAVYWNDGTGTFRQMRRLPGGPLIAVGDVTGDTLLDIILRGAPGGLTHLVLPQTVGQEFGDPVSLAITTIPDPTITFVDLDGDARPELLAHDRFRAEVHPVDPGSGVGPASHTLTTWAKECLVADLDRDGDEDLLFRSWPSRVVMNIGSLPPRPLFGRIKGTPAGGGWPIVTDLDDDGDRDFISWPGLGRPSFWINDGHGSFHPDTATYSYVGSFTPRFDVGTPFVFHIDLEGDGDKDLIILGGDSNPVHHTVLRQGPVWTRGTLIPFTDAAGDAVTGDLDGDGLQDLVLARSYNGTNEPHGMFWLRNMGGSFSSPNPIGPTAGVTGVGLIDFDRDGDLDAVRCPGVGSAEIWFNDGSGSFSSPFLLQVDGGPALIADIDGDGLEDILIPNYVWNGRGFLTFSNAVRVTRETHAVDVDLDGDLDLFSGSAYYSENLNQGAGWTVVTQAPCDYQGVSGYGIADIDGDGDPDVVSTASVFVNTTRDLSSSPWARPGRSTVLSVYGNAGDAWWLGGSLGVYATPLPPYGRLFLDPTQMFFLATDSIGPTGVGTVSFSIPDPTPLLGTTTFWQALVQGANSVGLTRLHQTTIEQL